VKIYRNPHVLAGALAMFFACYLYLPSASAGLISDTEWKVTRGDTLYAIGRAIYPGDVRRQAQLRQDIIKLNPSVFVNDANNMGIGDVLKLPNYVVPKSAPPKRVSPKIAPPKYVAPKYVAPKMVPPKISRPEPETIPLLVPPPNNAPKPRPEADEPVIAPIPDKVAPRPTIKFVAPAQDVETQPESPMSKEQPASSPSRAEGATVLSIGYSYGGDKLVDVIDGSDIFAGNGLQLRLGYEQMFQRGSGYRISLGLQYYTLLNQNASFQDAYLQLAYQYRADPIVYGIGVVSDAGATLKTNATTTGFDAAIGAVMYLEFVGRSALNGLGLSVTSLDIKEKNSGTSSDASRAELYYSWKF